MCHHPKHPKSIPSGGTFLSDSWPGQQALTIPKFPGDVVPLGSTVVQQCLGIWAVPLQATFPQQGIESKDQMKPWAVCKAVENIQCIFCTEEKGGMFISKLERASWALAKQQSLLPVFI